LGLIFLLKIKLITGYATPQLAGFAVPVPGPALEPGSMKSADVPCAFSGTDRDF
jgi:hypothetical protein